jgi:hypothetical protein
MELNGDGKHIHTPTPELNDSAHQDSHIPGEQNNISKSDLFLETPKISSKSQGLIRDPQSGELSKCDIWVERQNVYGAAFSSDKKKRKKRTAKINDRTDEDLEVAGDQQPPFLVIGFDTEFMT